MTKALLNEHDKARLLEFYQTALEKHGPYSPKALHWITQGDQERRFAALAQIANLSGCSILDVGCGVGDLYYFLLKKFSNFKYTGIDIVPDMIFEAAQKYPNVEFLTADIFSIEKNFDYVLCSGALTYHVSGGRQFYYDMIAHMFYLANKGVAFNMLDAELHTTDRDYLSYRWSEVREVCQQLTGNYKIVTGYEPGDFTVWLYK